MSDDIIRFLDSCTDHELCNIIEYANFLLTAGEGIVVMGDTLDDLAKAGD